MLIGTEFAVARDHVRWCIRLCKMQLESNRYFVYAHPTEATNALSAVVAPVHAARAAHAVLRVRGTANVVKAHLAAVKQRWPAATM